MEPQIFIETPRLILRQWKISDHEPFIALNKDKAVMEFFPSISTKADTLSQLQRIQAHFAKHGYGRFAVERKDDHSFIGFTGPAYATIEKYSVSLLEIGWRLSKANWGQGFATEAAQACLTYCFDTLQIREIYSYTAVQNTRSEQVMKKIGMLKERYFDHPLIEEGHALRPHVLYKIER